MKTRARRMAFVTTAFATSVSYVPLAHAQTPATVDGEQDIVVTGSRFGSRSVAESVTPVDRISSEELSRGGRTEVQDMLKVAVPSFSTPRPNASGVGDFTTPPTLRGLSTGQVLLLVNGKRRHSAGDLSTSNGIGRGDVAYDFNAVPSAAISSVEILRDGASAQYGSDAIAGVINLALDKSVGGSIKVTSGVTKEGDGEYVDVSLGYGVRVLDEGVIRVSFQYKNYGISNRSVADTRQQYFGINPLTGALVAPSALYGSGVGLTPSTGNLDPREATINRVTSREGTSPYGMKTVFVNADVPVGPSVTAYAFGGYSDLNGTTPFFFRRAAQNETVRAIYPNGFIPNGEIRLRNVSAYAGFRGDDIAGFKWDISTGFGRSLIDNSTSNTNNVSYGAASPTRIYQGSTRFDQWTNNLDLSQEFDMGDDSPLKLALGAEYREERYRLLAGEPISYTNGGVRIIDGPAAGTPAPVGTQPSPGISPNDATFGRRNSKSVYGEVEKVFFKRLTFGGALRYENFSDFGSTTNFKVSGRLEIADPIAIRGSYSTGFRAPHLAQSYFSNTTTSFINGNPVQIRTLPTMSAAAQLIGASALKPEKAKNISLGAVLQTNGWTATVDAYQIRLKDRIVISSNFQDARVTNLLAANGITGIGGATYITNAVDTTTRGIDVTVNGRFDLANLGRLSVLLAGNYNKTKFDRISGTPAALSALGITTPLFDLTQQVRISDSQPRSKVLLNLSWTSGDFSLGLTNTLYGKVSAVAFTTLTPAQIAALTPGYKVRLVPIAGSANSQVVQTFGQRLITDLQLSYDLSKAMRLSVGVNNLFDIYPEQNIRSTVAGATAAGGGSNGSDNAGTFPYNAISPFGFNGMSFFGSIGFKF